MTREQKIDWLKNASTEQLLHQFEVSVRYADKAFEICSKNDDFTIEGIFEDLKLAKAEVLRRMK